MCSIANPCAHPTSCVPRADRVPRAGYFHGL